MGTHRALRGGGTVDDTAFVEASAYVNGTASVGARSYLGHGVYVDPGVVIGNDVIICDRVRVEADVPDATTVACDCCTGGGGGGGSSVLNVDSIATVGSRLDALDSTGRSKGTLVYVGNDTFPGQGSVHRYYTLVYGENLTADGIEIVNSVTFGTDGAQWLSLDTVNQQFLTKLFVAVDPANISGIASDENDGFGTTLANAKLHPLRTFQELNRRNFGRQGTSQVQIALMSDDDSTPIMTNYRGATGDDQPVIIGDMTQFGADYTVTAYLPAIPASNLGFTLIATGIGATANEGKLVTNAALTKWAFIQEGDEADGARLTQPNAFDPLTFSGSLLVEFDDGETIRVWDLPILTQWPFPGDSQFPTVWHCEVQGSLTTPQTFDLTNFGNSSPVPAHSIINGFLAMGGQSGEFVGCQFAKTQSVLNQLGTTQLVACGLRDVNVGIRGGSMLIGQNFDSTGGSLSADSGAAVIGDNSSSLSAFSVDAAINSYNVSKSNFSMSSLTPLYGNVAGLALKVLANSLARLTQSLTTIAAAVPHPFEIAGVGYDIADLPVVDDPNQASITTN